MDIKGTLRIPTRETYAFIELHVEGDEEEVVEAYFKALDYYRERELERNRVREEDPLQDEITFGPSADKIMEDIKLRKLNKKK